MLEAKHQEVKVKIWKMKPAVMPLVNRALVAETPQLAPETTPTLLQQNAILCLR